MATAANSPFFFGRELWRETRIALFEQATDTRPEELKAQGVRPRVWFGERWITSIFDLFEENVRYFPALLPVCDDEDPEETLRSGGVPRLSELRLHNGTVYRWNRPIYDVVRERPHLRVENRVLPAGPTVVDTLANAAFYYGLVRALAEADRPIWSQMSFSAAEENFHAGARDGIDARVYWPGLGEVPAAELVVRRLLPLAYEGLDRWGIDPGDRDRLLEIIERRCVTLTNGAAWQAAAFHRLYEGRQLERLDALAADDRRLPRAHARQPAGAHLAAALNPSEDVAGLLAELVRIDSVNPSLVPGAAGEREIAAFVADWARDAGLEVEVLEATPGRPSVVARARGSGGGRTLLLCGHMDTVTVAGMTDPHSPRVEGERLFGRGAYDMKAGVAAALVAAREAAGLGLAGDVVVAAVADEEHASLGVREVVASVSADAAIVTEPTELELVVAHKGFVWSQVEVSGRAAHGSRPHLGVDAIVKSRTGPDRDR